MRTEREDLIQEIRQQDKRLRALAGPFGGYRNVLNVDDIYFEDNMMTPGLKNYLQVTDKERGMNVKFNEMAAKFGLRNT